MTGMDARRRSSDSGTIAAMTVARLMDVKQSQNKEGKTVLYLAFEYMDTDLKKFIHTFRQTGENTPSNIVTSLMFQLCKGVAFCHGHGMLHRY